MYAPFEVLGYSFLACFYLAFNICHFIFDALYVAVIFSCVLLCGMNLYGSMTLENMVVMPLD